MSKKTYDEQLALFKGFEAAEEKSEKTIVKIYAKKLITYKQYMGQLFENYEEDGKLTYDEMIIYGRLAKMDATLRGLTVSLYSESTKEITSALTSAYITGFDGTSEIISRAWGKKSLIPIIKEEEMHRALTNEISGLKWTDRMDIHRDHAAAKIRETIVRGLYEGESYAQMAKRLETALGKDVPGVLRIVRTESRRVFAQASKDRWDKISSAGFKVTKEWITSEDEKVRSNHAPMHGIIIPYESDFLLPNGNSGPEPCMIGAPEDDIECRCFSVKDIIDDETPSNQPDDPFVEYTDVDEIPAAYSEITDALERECKIVLNNYTGYDSQDINSALRSGEISERVSTKIASLEKILINVALPENIVLKRGATFSCFVGYEDIRDISEIGVNSLIGKRLVDEAFVSTSLIKPIETGRDVIMRINAPKGYSGLYLEPVTRSKFKGQHEILLNRHCVFEVESATINDNKLYMEVNLLNDSHDK